MAASAQIEVRVVAAEMVAEKYTDEGKTEAQEKTAKIYVFFHKLTCGRGINCPTARAVLPKPAANVTYKVWLHL